jgi:hypothetical protein
MGAAAAVAFVTLFVLFAITLVRLEAYAQDAAALRVAFNEANRRAVEGGQPPVEQPPKQEQPPVGQAPRGIVDSICQDNGRWRVVYTDGTTDEDAGQCSGPAGAAPSPAQIEVAFAAYCRDNGDCRGPSGKPGTNGKNGQNVTIAQAVEAIATYCDARGQCRGEKGDSGTQGPPPSADQILAGLSVYCADGACRGEQGDKGERGPGPTDEEIAAEVADYCTEDRCRGPKGEPGDDSTVPGPKGDAGRGIEDAECADGRWRITYDDGSIDEDAGSCAPAPAPTVTETVTEPPDPEPTE